LEEIARNLRFAGHDDETNILRICIALNLKNLAEARLLLRRLVRSRPQDTAVADLYTEVDAHFRAETVARAVLARERGELGTRKIILSVDDSPTVRRALEFAFSTYGHVVVSVEDAEKALQALSELRPDIVFVDFQLPGIDGLDLCQRIRRELTTTKVPVVVLSSKTKEGFEARALEMGADTFLRKPTSSAELLETLRRHTGTEDPEGVAPPSPDERLFGTMEILIDPE